MGGEVGAPTQPAGIVGRIRRWFAGLGFHQMWQLVVVAVLAVTALFGGLDTVDTKETPFAAGEQFSDGEYTLTITRAVLRSTITAGSRSVAPPAPGQRYLGVVATIHNDGTVPGTLRNELEPRDLPEATFYGTFRTADGSPVTVLNPGLGEEVAFLWTVPETALADGDSVTLRVTRKQFIELKVTYGKAWIDTDDYGQISIPVRGQP